MYLSEDHLAILAARVRHGVPGAADELRREIGPHMPRIVRRALRARTSRLPLDCWIRATAGAVADPLDHQQADPERLPGQVAWSICESLLDQLQAQKGRPAELKDTLPS